MRVQGLSSRPFRTPWARPSTSFLVSGLPPISLRGETILPLASGFSEEFGWLPCHCVETTRVRGPGGWDPSSWGDSSKY